VDWQKALLALDPSPHPHQAIHVAEDEREAISAHHKKVLAEWPKVPDHQTSDELTRLPPCHLGI
jgi:hypothetical protein